MDDKQAYTIISNQLINDINLSYEDIGLAAYVLSKTNCSVIDFESLISAHKTEREDVVNILKNLEANGYLQTVSVESADLYPEEDYMFIDCTKEGLKWK